MNERARDPMRRDATRRIGSREDLIVTRSATCLCARLRAASVRVRRARAQIAKFGEKLIIHACRTRAALAARERQSCGSLRARASYTRQRTRQASICLRHSVCACMKTTTTTTSSARSLNSRPERDELRGESSLLHPSAAVWVRIKSKVATLITSAREAN